MSIVRPSQPPAMEYLEESLPFPISEVCQETPHFCFIACLQSMLTDKGNTMTQTEILNTFPVELRRGHPTEEGSPKGLKSIEVVLKGLGLSKEPLLSDEKDSASEMRKALAKDETLW